MRRDRVALNSPFEREEFSEEMILDIAKLRIRREMRILNHCWFLPMPEDAGALRRAAVKLIVGTRGSVFSQHK